MKTEDTEHNTSLHMNAVPPGLLIHFSELRRNEREQDRQDSLS